MCLEDIEGSRQCTVSVCDFGLEERKRDCRVLGQCKEDLRVFVPRGMIKTSTSGSSFPFAPNLDSLPGLFVSADRISPF